MAPGKARGRSVCEIRVRQGAGTSQPPGWQVGRVASALVAEAVQVAVSVWAPERSDPNDPAQGRLRRVGPGSVCSWGRPGGQARAEAGRSSAFSGRLHPSN